MLKLKINLLCTTSYLHPSEVVLRGEPGPRLEYQLLREGGEPGPHLEYHLLGVPRVWWYTRWVTI